MLGSIDRPKDLRQNFHSVIWRVGVGTLAVSFLCIPVLKAAVFVAGRYSIRRKVTGVDGAPFPIIGFRTQQLPIFHTLSQALVLVAYANDLSQRFVAPELDPRVRHGIAVAFKAVVIQHTQNSLPMLAERCGSQGLFKHNQIIESEAGSCSSLFSAFLTTNSSRIIQLELRGVAIAEGDVLALTIRVYPISGHSSFLHTLTISQGLASELLIGRYKMPPPTDPASLLARHEAGLFDECRRVVASLGMEHRSEGFNRLVLPLCRPLVEAIGHRMAYEAAVKEKVHPDVLAMYEAGVVKLDSSWYVEHARLDRRAQHEMEDRALTAMLPNIEDLLDATGAEPYCGAPIVSDASWAKFVDGLPHYSGKAVLDLIPTEPLVSEKGSKIVMARL